MDFILKMHSGLRWVVLLLLLVVIILSFVKKGKKPFGSNDKLLAIMALAFTHIQVVIGFILYFGNSSYSGFKEMGNSALRLYALEHPLMMLVGAILITVGYSSSKRQTDDAKKFSKIGVFYLIGLLLILSRIPWPFLASSGDAGWF